MNGWAIMLAWGGAFGASPYEVEQVGTSIDPALNEQAVLNAAQDDTIPSFGQLERSATEYLSRISSRVGFRCERTMARLKTSPDGEGTVEEWEAVAFLETTFQEPCARLSSSDLMGEWDATLRLLGEKLPHNRGQSADVNRIMTSTHWIADTPDWNAELIEPDRHIALVSKFRSSAEQMVVTEYHKDGLEFDGHQIAMQDASVLPSIFDLKELCFPLFIGQEAEVNLPLFEWIEIESGDTEVRCFSLEHEVWGDDRLFLGFEVSSGLPRFAAIDSQSSIEGFERWAFFEHAQAQGCGLMPSRVLTAMRDDSGFKVRDQRLSEWDHDCSREEFLPEIAPGSHCFDRRLGRDAFTSWESGMLWPPDIEQFVRWKASSPAGWTEEDRERIYFEELAQYQEVADGGIQTLASGGIGSESAPKRHSNHGLRLWTGVLMGSLGLLALTRYNSNH